MPGDLAWPVFEEAQQAIEIWLSRPVADPR
jgi:hypothetical protein